MSESPLSPEAVEWLCYGEQGASSKAMFHRLLLGDQVDPFDRPVDVDDFQRCERLRRAVPEIRERLDLMASVSPEWSALVRSWDEIAAALDDELPGLCDHGWWAIADRTASAPRAAALIAAACDSAR